MIGADLGVRSLPVVEPVRGLGGLGGCDGTSHYGGPRVLGGLGLVVMMVHLIWWSW